MTRRILSVCFPMLAIDRFRRLEAARRRYLPRADSGEQAEWPLVLVEHGAKGTRITAANPAAFEAGAAVGQALTDARAACPTLRVEQADAEGDAMLLEGLARWAMRYSPIVAVDGTDGLFIDMTGCDHLFGGEAGLVGDCLRRLGNAGFCVLAGLAETPGLAWALARYGHGAEIVAGEEAKERAAGLPVEALRLSGERLLLLRRLGLKTIGAVAAVPRAALERRFRSREAAQSVQLRLDQMTGAVREPLDPLYPPLPCRVFLAMPEPVIDVGGVEFALDELLVRLSHRLERDGQGARCFRLAAFRADGGSSTITVRLSRPGRAVQPIKRLFSDRLQEIDCGFGIDGFLLAADNLERMAAEQQAMVAGRGDAAGADDPAIFCDGIAPLIDVLANRIGARNVFQWAPVATHIPERAARTVAVGSTLAWQEWEEAAGPMAQRPFRMFDRPEPVEVTAEVPDGPPIQFTWRRMQRIVTRASGPERIAPEWWRTDRRGLAVRDYFVVEDREGRQYWLYREGGFGAEGEAFPHWYVHGLFT